MQKLLTGYATTFNLRHNRHGHLFQNRYKSILCQEETYLLELVRYIHLNPIRAGIVPTLEMLRDYRYCGHSFILGRNRQLDTWMPSQQILLRFGTPLSESRKAYENFVRDGLALGHQPNLTGGGLVRSCGGWRELHSAKDAGVFLQSDERILGDSTFVDQVLQTSEDDLKKKSRYHRENIDLEKVILAVGMVLGMEPLEVCKAGKQPRYVRARGLLCYWAVREIGATETVLAKHLNISQPAISQAVMRGERMILENQWKLEEVLRGIL